MRLLVVTTDPGWTMSTRLLMTMAHGLAERGETVGASYPRKSATAAGLATGFPALALRSMDTGGSWAQWRALRGVVAATRPGVVLVSGEHDALMAALVMGRRGGVVRRVPVNEPLQESWRTSLAERRSRIALFGGLRAHGEPVLDGVAWPPREDNGRHTPIGAPQLVIVPGSEQRASGSVLGSGSTAVALRAAAHLRTRHPTLGVTLVGDELALQSVRIHAASLDLADHLRTQSMHAFLREPLANVVAVWVTANGDEGAVAVLSAMSGRVPVIVPAGGAIEALIAPRITGFVSADAEPTTVVADLARLLADDQERATMGQAAAARAARLYDWPKFLDRVSEALAHAGGARHAAARSLPSPTPA